MFSCKVSLDRFEQFGVSLLMALSQGLEWTDILVSNILSQVNIEIDFGKERCRLVRMLPRFKGHQALELCLGLAIFIDSIFIIGWFDRNQITMFSVHINRTLALKMRSNRRLLVEIRLLIDNTCSWIYCNFFWVFLGQLLSLLWIQYFLVCKLLVILVIVTL